jgi:AAA domain
MFLVELVVQGVRGFRELVRLRFQSGFNFVAAGNEAGKTTATDALQRLLFPSNQAGLLEALVSRHTPAASRAALVMFSDDGAYYRIIQDLTKRAVNVSTYNAGTKDFALLHKDWDNAAQFMTGFTTGMSEQDFAKVFIFRRDQCAGAGSSEAIASAPAQMPRAQPARPAPRRTGEKASANEAKLVALRETLRKAEEAADAEYRAQSAKLALDETRKKLTSLEEIEQKQGEMEATLTSLKGCESLPQNLSELIEAHEHRLGQKSADADRLHSELQGLKAQLGGIPSVNLFTDKLFIGGAVLGVLSILSPFVVPVQYASYFLVGVFLAVGLMATAWYNGSRKNSQRKTVTQEIEGLEKELAELEKKFGQEGAEVTAAMRMIGATTPAELKDKSENYRYFLSLRDDIEEQRKRMLGDHTPESLHEEYNTQQQAALELEKAARAVAQYNVDTYSIRQDIERIESESSPGAAWDFGAEAHDLSVDFMVPAAPSAGQAGVHAELGIVSRIGGIEMETLVPAVEAAAQRNLSLATNGKYVRIEVGQDGGPPVVHAKDDSIVSYAELSHGTRDLVYFCLRAGLVEALAGKRRLPFILDDPLAGFDPSRQKAACQVLRSLGTKTQVILLSSNAALKADGDVAAELK